MSSTNNLHFIPLNESHIPLIAKWLQAPHVAEFWQEPLCDSEEKLKEKYLVKLSHRGVHPFLLTIDEVPAGYFQYYQANLVGGGWWPNSGAYTFGIDQYIGEKDFLGKGLGTRAIRTFVEFIFKSTPAQEIISDPSPDNSRVIKVYEKVGFRAQGPIDTPGGKALLMKITKDFFALTSNK